MRFDHTMIRVNNLEDSIKFYRDGLGMKVLSNKEYPEGKFTLVFFSYGDNQAKLELTYNWDQEKNYSIGNGFGHLALVTNDIYKVCERLEKNGYDVYRKPGSMKHGSTVIAFVRDPNGYSIEFIQRNEQ